MTGNEAESFIESCIKSDATRAFTADTARKMYEKCGSPLEDIPVVHIAGTNGKGSVGNFTACALAACGYKTGCYSSPAVFSRWETIRLFDVTGRKNTAGTADCGISCTKGLNMGSIMVRNINEKETGRLAEKIKEISDEIKNEDGSLPSSFEVETMIAFTAFRYWNTDAAIVECGMGGRNDATNVLCSPADTVFTGIGMDHAGMIGPTLENIAENKADIIRKGASVISAAQDSRVARILQDTAEKRNAACLRSFSEDKLKIIEMRPGESRFIYDGHEYIIHLNGREQIRNACLAVEILRDLKENHGFKRIRYEFVRNGLIAARIYGRWDIVKYAPAVILDGAHNPPAFKALSEFLSDYYGKRRFIFIYGTFSDKEYKENAVYILKHAAKIYTVKAPGKRGMDAALLAGEINRLRNGRGGSVPGEKRNGKTDDLSKNMSGGSPDLKPLAFPAESMEDACRHASEDTVSDRDIGGIVITGSLSILKAAYRAVLTH